jgi:hypothetical protein
MASELTLRIMQRIVDKKLGPDHQPRQSAQGRTQSRDIHLSSNEENSLKQLINPASSGRSSARGTAQSTAPRTSPKSKTVQEFAASYNKGTKSGARPSQKPAPVKSKTMNLNDFVQTIKK